TPTTFATGYLYAGMGYTTVNEAAMPVLSARHTHEELHDTPIVDKSTLVLMANNEIVLDLIEAGEIDRAKHVVGWLIWAAKADGGDDWGTMRSDAVHLADEFNKRKNLTTDAGAILFGNAITITADGPWQHVLYQLTGHKWGNLDVENETGCGIVPYVYKEQKLVNAIQWAVGLELMLLIDDPWRVFLTTDHPNGGCFWRYPELIHLLMNAEFRKAQVKQLPEKARQRIVLADLDREYTLSEITIITAASPARSLGLARKGHLGVGADADVAIYPAR